MIRWEIVHSLNDSITGRLTQSTALAPDRSGAWSVGRSLARRITRSVYRCSARSALDTKSAQASVLVFKDDFEILSFSHLHARWSFCCARNHSRAAKELSLILDWSFPGPRVENCLAHKKQFLLPCYFQRLYFIVWTAPCVTSRGHL